MRGKRWWLFLLTVAAVVGLGRLVETANAGAGSEDSTPLSFATPHAKTIPADALRLRIIANSDSAQDQELKRQVRDAVVVRVAQMLQSAKNANEARNIVDHHLPDLQKLAQNIVDQDGFRYHVKADVGRVPFPTKVYGNQVYPAGDYEALRLVIGQGKGANWWCVLFPPLCFVDIADGDAVPNTGGFPDLPPLETITVPNADGGRTQVAVRMASLDYGEELWKAVSRWFSAAN
jgi:stage II sporulation protein R